MPISNMTPTDHTVDVVFCIDMTCGNSIAEQLRHDLKNLFVRLAEDFAANRGFELHTLRVRFVLFRDYEYDSEPMIESQFFLLNEELDEALAFLSVMYPGGGGDMPECAFEALALAVKSEWTEPRDCHRRIICLTTDSSAKPLGACRDCVGYPAQMPESVEDVLAEWLGMPRRGINRIMLFAPNDTCWDELQLWEGLFYVPVERFCGCTDVDFVDTFVNLVTNS
ncbi:MAG: VWA domain-containing protein [Clostridia bacterium]|nr:VWA domain-containing protein [Clostridia bacterium]